MEITDISANVYNVPVTLPLAETAHDRPVVLAVVETDEGIAGYGETGYLNPQATADFIEREIAEEIIGMNPLETERVWEKLYQNLNPRAQTGVWSTGVSAIDIALWDIKGKQYDEPVWRLLGGARSEVPAYITFGFPEYDIDQLRTLAENLVADGNTRLKMVVGGNEDSTPVVDAKRVRAVREVVGSDVELMIDANYQYSVEEAIELCNRVEDQHISWFEEPVYGNDVELLSSLRERTRIPIAAGQNEGHAFRHRDLIQHDAIDISQPNVCFVGGFTEGLRVASMAQANHLRIANGGGWPFQNMHLQAGVANGSRVEFHFSIWEANKEMYETVPEPENGTISLSEDPGLGLEPDWDALSAVEQ
ncbi:mandelate racemase/muconate lactonizing enzyme family protein [Halobellus captivus]|uniref:mandelate racemase/muconate lactonizing enzyme family protein n=1 Tax=Halobellus captivus TaxID=2592614 RepID=UPI0011A2A279|nr:mandelate racemase/muconate lactonizing enzyme family protein [Halobellus captivus]